MLWSEYVSKYITYIIVGIILIFISLFVWFKDKGENFLPKQGDRTDLQDNKVYKEMKGLVQMQEKYLQNLSAQNSIF